MAAPATIPAESVDPLDDLFADPDGIIASLVAEMPAPAPDAVARVSALLGGAR